MQGGIDEEVMLLSPRKSDAMSQRAFIKWLLDRNDKVTPYFMFKNWNVYKQFVLKYRRVCSYAGFRRAVWKMKDDGFLIALPKPAPKNERERLFGTTYYRLSPNHEKFL